MRILLACQQSPHRYPIPAYGFWRTYLVEGLREAGHEVVEVPGADWARGLVRLERADHDRWLDEQWSRTVDTARSVGGIDLFLGYLYPAQIDAAAVRLLRAGGVPTVNFFCDNLREFRRLPVEFEPFDLHWVPELGAVPMYAKRGWSALFAPMPCWVPPARRVVRSESSPGLCFIGSRDPLRSALMEYVARSGLPLTLCGTGWSRAAAEAGAPQARPTWRARLEDWMDFTRRQGPGMALGRLAARGRRNAGLDIDFDFSQWVAPSPDDDGYARWIAESAVALGVNRCPLPAALGPRSVVYSRLRDIEAPMLGACYLTEWAPELESLYELGQEIEVYRDETELVEKASELLSDLGRRLALRHAALKRVHADHGVGSTVRRIARHFGLPD